ncbi:MAG: class I SAM-dependent methyltransferase, partial [Desulfovibrionales bacterium]
PVWLRWLVELDNPFTRSNRASFIIGHLGLEPGMAVLDAGCGPGRLTIPLAREVGENGMVAAVDIQAGMLARAKEKARKADLHNIRFILAGLGKGTLERNQFDRAVMVTVLGEIPNRQGALGEVFDSLKPGGILSVTELIFDPPFPAPKHGSSPGQGRRFCSRKGFRQQDRVYSACPKAFCARMDHSR